MNVLIIGFAFSLCILWMLILLIFTATGRRYDDLLLKLRSTGLWIFFGPVVPILQRYNNQRGRLREVVGLLVVFLAMIAAFWLSVHFSLGRR